MKTNNSMEYTAPALEVITTLVEQGFTASFGNEIVRFAHDEILAMLG